MHFACATSIFIIEEKGKSMIANNKAKTVSFLKKVNIFFLLVPKRIALSYLRCG